jgi:hypothetical protein
MHPRSIIRCVLASSVQLGAISLLSIPVTANDVPVVPLVGLGISLGPDYG